MLGSFLNYSLIHFFLFFITHTVYILLHLCSFIFRWERQFILVEPHLFCLGQKPSSRGS